MTSRKHPARAPSQHAGMTDTSAVVAAGPSPSPEALHSQFQRSGPRYAIYPTAEHFNGRFGAPALMAALLERRIASQTVCRVELHGDRIDVTPGGRCAVDEIAAVFDRYLHERARPARPACATR